MTSIDSRTIISDTKSIVAFFLGRGISATRLFSTVVLFGVFDFRHGRTRTPEAICIHTDKQTNDLNGNIPLRRTSFWLSSTRLSVLPTMKNRHWADASKIVA